jgi:hypothetical protein
MVAVETRRLTANKGTKKKKNSCVLPQRASLQTDHLSPLYNLLFPNAELRLSSSRKPTEGTACKQEDQVEMQSAEYISLWKTLQIIKVNCPVLKS